MKIASSLKSLKKRDLNSKLVRRKGKVYVINKNPRFKLDKDRNERKRLQKTYNGFTKFVLWGTIAVIAILVILAITLL